VSVTPLTPRVCVSVMGAHQGRWRLGDSLWGCSFCALECGLKSDNTARLEAGGGIAHAAWPLYRVGRTERSRVREQWCGKPTAGWVGHPPGSLWR
jgi:hypothetical protein